MSNNAAEAMRGTSTLNDSGSLPSFSIALTTADTDFNLARRVPGAHALYGAQSMFGE